MSTLRILIFQQRIATAFQLKPHGFIASQPPSLPVYPARPVAPADGTGVAPADGTGVAIKKVKNNLA